jgi:hypothetical protein
MACFIGSTAFQTFCAIPLFITILMTTNALLAKTLAIDTGLFCIATSTANISTQQTLILPALITSCFVTHLLAGL